jgi:hypothetical protein
MEDGRSYEIYREVDSGYKRSKKSRERRLTRSTIMGHCRVGRPWADLAVSSPLLLFSHMNIEMIYTIKKEARIQNSRLLANAPTPSYTQIKGNL